jgi:YegS/Rv2252/BmrU family lipid kinase
MEMEDNTFPKRIAAILHGKKRKTSFLKNVLHGLENHPNYELQIFQSSNANDQSVLGNHVQRLGFAIVLIAGGDGSFHQVINGFDFSISIPKLILIPTGTGNDFISGKKYRCSINGILNALATESWEPNDLILLESENKRTYSLNSADVGFGGYVIHLLNRQRRFLDIGKINYAVAILRAFLSYKTSFTCLNFNGKKIEGSHLMIAICNGPVFGNGLTIHPRANSTDGILNITQIGAVSLFDYLKQVRKLKRGQFIQHPEVSYHTTAESISIELLSGKGYVQADGELVSFDSKISFQLISNRIQILKY